MEVGQSNSQGVNVDIFGSLLVTTRMMFVCTLGRINTMSDLQRVLPKTSDVLRLLPSLL